MRVAVAQINTTVGDFSGNLECIRDCARRAEQGGAELVIFPELAVPGYPPRDLLDSRSFVDANLRVLASLAKTAGECALLVGYADYNESEHGKLLTNSAALLHRGQIISRHHKSLLPEYDVFDERRYFEPVDAPKPAELNGVRFGVSICEDAWNEPSVTGRPLYRKNPICGIAASKPAFIVNISASPFVVGKDALRRKLFRAHCARHSVPFIVCNLVGGNDQLVFDGNSFALDAGGRLTACAKAFEESLMFVETGAHGSMAEPSGDDVEAMDRALRLGLRDYLRKCGLSGRVVLGLSGGIDSAVVACLAAFALGPENVTGILMPSKFSSKGSVEDSLALAKNLGIRTVTLPIQTVVDEYEKTLSAPFQGTQRGVAEENIQARVRGNLLMAWSNKFGAMALSTGNKSELATGYCTLYGDMSGGLALISDVPKMEVYELGRYLNRMHGKPIPEEIFTKAPSAELKPDQTDQDILPPYEQLDKILHLYIEEMKSVPEIVATGFDMGIVQRVAALVDNNEYKRMQAAPGIKVTSKAFGTGRRMPIARRNRTP